MAAPRRPSASNADGSNDASAQTLPHSPASCKHKHQNLPSPTLPPSPTPSTPLHRHSKNPPEISLRVLLPLLYLLEQKGHDADDINSIVKSAAYTVGMSNSNISYYSLRQASPDDVWVSIRFIDELRNLIFSKLYGMDELPPKDHPLWQMWREAGHVALRKEILGSVLFPVLRSFGSPGMIYRNMPFSLSKGNTVLSCTILNTSVTGRVEVSMKPNHPETYKEGHECCLNRIGCLEAVPFIWGLKKAHVEHTHCIHDPINPANECRYVVRFEERWLLGALKSVMGILLCLFISAYHVPLPPEASLPIGLLVFLAFEGWRRYLEVQTLYQQDQKHIRNLIDLYDKRYMDLWKESEELRRLTLDNRNISAYVPPSLLDRLRYRREQLPRLGGSKREATIVFVDIRNYSTLAERLDPEQTLNVLNECFSAWVKDVQSHDGTVLEFLGDGMLAVFGAPNDLPGHPGQAVRCLQTMVHTMERLNETWSVTGGMRSSMSKYASSSKLGFRGGVHTGTVIAGNLGSATQMKYAVVGDTVNVAARLEQLNKSLGTVIAVSGDTWNRLPEDLKKWVRPKGHHFVKGRDQAVDVYAYGSIPLVAPRKHRRLSLEASPFIPPLRAT